MLTRTAQNNISWLPGYEAIHLDSDNSTLISTIRTYGDFKLPFAVKGQATIGYTETKNMSLAEFKRLNEFGSASFTKCIIEDKDECICGYQCIIKDDIIVYAQATDSTVYISKKLFRDPKSVVNKFIINDILPSLASEGEIICGDEYIKQAQIPVYMWYTHPKELDESIEKLLLKHLTEISALL